MRRLGGWVVLALVIGFVAYRGSLATGPRYEYQASQVPGLTGCHSVSQPHFDLFTGIPVPLSCTYPSGQRASLLSAPMEMLDLWVRCVWLGLGVVLVALFAQFLVARRRVAVLVAACCLCLLGCGAEPPRGEQVSIRTATAEEPPGYATFANQVADVAADPETGTPDTGSWRWPTGYTAWRFGSETEVLDASGTRVLVTGHRYHLYLGGPWSDVIVRVEPCPPGTCAVLGFHLDNS